MPDYGSEVLQECLLPSFIESKYTGSKTQNIPSLAWFLEFEMEGKAVQYLLKPKGYGQGVVEH